MIFEKKDSLNLWKFNEEGHIDHLSFFNKQSFHAGGDKDECSWNIWNIWKAIKIFKHGWLWKKNFQDWETY